MSDYASWRLSIEKPRLERLEGSAKTSARTYKTGPEYWFCMGAATAFDCLQQSEVPDAENLVGYLLKGIQQAQIELNGGTNGNLE